MMELDVVVSRDLRSDKEKVLLVVDGTNYNVGNIPEDVLVELVNKVEPVLDIYGVDGVADFVSEAKTNKKTVEAVGSRLHGGFRCTLNDPFSGGISGLISIDFEAGSKINYGCPIHTPGDKKLTRLEHLEVAIEGFRRRDDDVRELFITNDEMKTVNKKLRDELKKTRAKLKEASTGTGEEKLMVVGVGSQHFKVTKREFGIITKILGKVENSK